MGNIIDPRQVISNTTLLTNEHCRVKLYVYERIFVKKHKPFVVLLSKGTSDT